MRNVHIRPILPLLAAASLLGGLGPAEAEVQRVDRRISYQGRLEGVTGTTTVQFRIFDGSGQAVWGPEIHIVIPDADGRFAAVVGITEINTDGDTIPDLDQLDATDLELEIAVQSGSETLTVLSPRQKLFASFHAAVAQSVVDDSISTDKLKDLAVTRFKLAHDAVDGDRVVDESLTGADITDASLGGVDITDGSLTSADLASNTITEGRIASGQIGTRVLQDGGVTGADIANGTITGTDVANGTITGSDIANASITGTDIADKSIGQSDISNSIRSTGVSYEWQPVNSSKKSWSCPQNMFICGLHLKPVTGGFVISNENPGGLWCCESRTLHPNDL